MIQISIKIYADPEEIKPSLGLIGAKQATTIT